MPERECSCGVAIQPLTTPLWGVPFTAERKAAISLGVHCSQV